MKTAVFRASFYLLVSLVLILLLQSCTQDDSVTPVQDPVLIQQQVQTGDWRITSFIDSGKDETSHFNGYVFTFAADGTLEAGNGQSSYAGSWSIAGSQSPDDSPGDVDFHIHFNLTNYFEDLNEDWHIVSQTSSLIELIHISGGNGGTDRLTFEKM